MSAPACLPAGLCSRLDDDYLKRLELVTAALSSIDGATIVYVKRQKLAERLAADLKAMVSLWADGWLAGMIVS